MNCTYWIISAGQLLMSRHVRVIYCFVLVDDRCFFGLNCFCIGFSWAVCEGVVLRLELVARRAWIIRVTRVNYVLHVGNSDSFDCQRGRLLAQRPCTWKPYDDRLMPCFENRLRQSLDRGAVVDGCSFRVVVPWESSPHPANCLFS